MNIYEAYTTALRMVPIRCIDQKRASYFYFDPNNLNKWVWKEGKCILFFDSFEKLISEKYENTFHSEWDVYLEKKDSFVELYLEDLSHELKITKNILTLKIKLLQEKVKKLEDKS